MVDHENKKTIVSQLNKIVHHSHLCAQVVGLVYHDVRDGKNEHCECCCAHNP